MTGQSQQVADTISPHRRPRRPDVAVEMFRLTPKAQLAIFPHANHFLIVQEPDRLLPVIARFLDAPSEDR